MQKDSFLKATTNFFKKNKHNDTLMFSDDSVNFVNKQEDKLALKQKREVQIFNTILQNRNWKGKHLELLNEYRDMDSNYPIIAAALKIFTQEACITGDMLVETSAGFRRIDELYANKPDFFLVKTINYKENLVTWAECSNIVLKGKKQVYKVTLGDNKGTFKCTIDHKIKSQLGFTELQNLQIGDLVGTLRYDIDPECGCKTPVIDYTPITEIATLGEELVYDLVDVTPHNSFLLKIGDDFYVNVHNCSRDTDGNILTIRSDIDSVREELIDLFNNQLKINSQSAIIIKSFLKFGNHWAFLDLRKGEGVVDLMHLAPEMIRIAIEDTRIFSQDNFKYQLLTPGGTELENWELVHFKYLDDIETLPYGQSILRPIVETYRRIVMMRDALIVYRITRAPQRLLFKLDTGALDPDAAELYAKDIKKQLYKKPLYNQNGEFDYKYSPLSIQENIYMNSFEGDVSDVRVLEGACFKGNTQVRTTNGLMSIQEIAEYFEVNSKKIYTLAINEHGKETNGKIEWCAKTKTVDQLYKITYTGFLGKTYTEECTDNHPFMVPDLSYVEAKNLKVGMELKGLGGISALNEHGYFITNIEIIDYPDGVDVYDLGVEEYHNFSLEGGIFVHNSNLGDVEDYKIIKDDLFAGLMIPKQYLQFDEVQTAKAALVQEDIRFANLIRQIQGFFVEGLLHIAVVHLHTKGYSKEEIESFTIEMNSNSTFAEKTRKELLEQRFAIAQMAWDSNNENFNFMSFTQTLKEILKFSDSQIKKIIEDQFIEKKMSWRLANLTQNGFYEDTEQDRLQKELEQKEENSVFNKLQFESVSFTNNLKSMLSENLEEELNYLLKPVVLKPTKKQVIKLFEKLDVAKHKDNRNKIL